MNDDLPNFLRVKEPQECKNRKTWHKHFRLAYWALFLIGGFVFIFTDRELAGLAMMGLGFIVFNIDTIQDIKHAEWHLKQLEKGDKND